LGYFLDVGGFDVAQVLDLAVEELAALLLLLELVD